MKILWRNKTRESIPCQCLTVHFKLIGFTVLDIKSPVRVNSENLMLYNIIFLSTIYNCNSRLNAMLQHYQMAYSQWESGSATTVLPLVSKDSKGMFCSRSLGDGLFLYKTFTFTPHFITKFTRFPIFRDHKLDTRLN